MENFNSEQLTSTSEVSCASVVFVPSVPLKKILYTESDTVPMAPISTRAYSARRDFGTIQANYRMAQSVRTSEASICCLLL